MILGTDHKNNPFGIIDMNRPNYAFIANVFNARHFCFESIRRMIIYYFVYYDGKLDYLGGYNKYSNKNLTVESS